MATKPKPYFSTIDQVVREFVGTSVTKSDHSLDLHVIVGKDGHTWMSNTMWIARPAYHCGLQKLIKKYPELASPGRWQLVRVGSSWAVEHLGEPNTNLPGYLVSAQKTASQPAVLGGPALRQKVERLGAHPYTVEYRSQGGRPIWPVESADIHRSQYGYVNGLYARALQSSFEANYFLDNHWDGDYVLNQGWTTPFELGSSGIFVFAHWHTLNYSAQSTVHNVKSGQARIIDGFLVEHRPETLA